MVEHAEGTSVCARRLNRQHGLSMLTIETNK